MAELVFDVGMHDGNDTAYYLASGYDVVAVEANPSLCAAARKRFADEIAAGRLTVCNVGIAAQAQDMEFWVSDRSEWSSFYKENATKAGVSASCIVVPTVRFADLLNDYPPAMCVKIDIEGSDTLCIRELERCSALPSYVSVELPTYVLDGNDGVATIIELLTKLGYRGFRCVRQNDWREITPSNMHRQSQMRKIVARADKFHPLLGMVLRRLHYRKHRMKGWRFVIGNSGPLPSQFPGRWMKYDETLAVCEALGALDRKLNAGGLGEWFDVHAVRI